MLAHDSTSSEHKVQNVIGDPILETMEDGEGYNFGRGEIETGTTAISAASPRDEKGSTDAQNDLEKTDVATTSAPRPTAFAKVEKSLASLGFFTPSSRRIKNQKVKRIGFTREIDGKQVGVERRNTSEWNVWIAGNRRPR